MYLHEKKFNFCYADGTNTNLTVNREDEIVLIINNELTRLPLKDLFYIYEPYSNGIKGYSILEQCEILESGKLRDSRGNTILLFNKSTKSVLYFKSIVNPILQMNNKYIDHSIVTDYRSLIDTYINDVKKVNYSETKEEDVDSQMEENTTTLVAEEGKIVEDNEPAEVVDTSATLTEFKKYRDSLISEGFEHREQGSVSLFFREDDDPVMLKLTESEECGYMLGELKNVTLTNKGETLRYTFNLNGSDVDIEYTPPKEEVKA
jgi:hypothetical protein